MGFCGLFAEETGSIVVDERRKKVPVPDVAAERVERLAVPVRAFVAAQLVEGLLLASRGIDPAFDPAEVIRQKGHGTTSLPSIVTNFFP